MKSELADYLNKEAELLKSRQREERAKLDCPLCDVLMVYSLGGNYTCPICSCSFSLYRGGGEKKQNYISGRLQDKCGK